VLQVSAFLASAEGRASWRLGRPAPSFKGPVDASGFLRCSPASTQTDGFFAAVLDRLTDAESDRRTEEESDRRAEENCNGGGCSSAETSALIERPQTR
jgi:hypothetical protein